MQEPSSLQHGGDGPPLSSSKPKVIELTNIKIQHLQQPNVEIVANSPLVKTPKLNYNGSTMDDDEDSDGDEEHTRFGRVAEHQSLLNGEMEREHLGVTNLDSFFQQVYVYFYEKGFWCMLADRILRLCTVFFMMIFSTFLFVFLNWYDMWHCQDVACKTVPVFRQDVWTMNAFHIIVLLFELVVCFYWMFLLVKYLRDLLGMLSVKHFFNIELNISEQDIQTIQWVEVIEKIIEFQNKKKINIIKNVDEFDILNRIMRKENYLISFINKDVMNLTLPFSQKTYLSEIIVYNLRIIVDNMFDSEFKVNESFVKSPMALRAFFVKLGLINLLLAPFLFVYIILYTSFKYLAELKNDPKKALGRRWSLYATFKFREYHELAHEYERRLKEAYGPSIDYMNQFPNVLLSIVANRAMFFISAIAGVIIVLSYLNNSLTLYLTVFNQNLLTWLTTLLLGWAFAKGFVIDEHAVFNPKQKLDDVCEILHHHDLKWKGKGHHHDVRNDFLSHFIPSYSYFLNEIISVFVTPIILIISLPRSAEKIATYVDQITVDYHGLGHICGHAAFKFTEYGNDMYGSQTIGATKNAASEHGKMELSYLSFVNRYPKYKPKEDNGEKAFIDNLNQSILAKKDSNKEPLDNINPAVQQQQPQQPVTTASPTVIIQPPKRDALRPPPFQQNDLSESRLLFNMLESQYLTRMDQSMSQSSMNQSFNNWRRK